MKKVWLAQYPEGVPEEINPDRYSSLLELFDETFKKFADKPGFYNLGASLTYREMDQMTEQLAGYFQQELNLEKGDRIAIMMPNCLQYPVAMMAALRAGLVVVNVNPLYTPTELVHQLKDSGTRAIIVLANFASTLQQALPDTPVEHVIVTRLGDLMGFRGKIVNLVLKYVKKMVPKWHIPGAKNFKSVMQKAQHCKMTPIAVTGEDIAFLQYTGGTTGVAKGAVLTHRNMVANAEQAGAWINPFTNNGHEVVITALPLYHIFALLANMIVFMKFGAKNILITNPRDIPNFIKELSRYKFTAITGVNTLFNALLHDPNFAKLDFSSLNITLAGGMALQQAVAVKWHAVTGCPVIEAYGLTETSPAATINPLNLSTYNGSIGLPIPSTLVSIRDDDDNELGPGEEGELCIKGPQVMREYWNRPEETAKVFTQSGWLRTGDMATVDGLGFVRVVDRKKDMIIVSGFNVYPNEVEDVIAHFPKVKEVAVVGVPLWTSGQAVKAYIVVKDGEEATEEEIIEYCRNHLTRYKVPKIIEFRDELPKSNVGKILRRALREEGEAQLKAAAAREAEE